MPNRLLLASIVLTLVSCAVMSRPDLKRLYESGATAAEQPPVVVVPGILGSRLRDTTTGAEVWPGGWNALLFSEYRSLALDIDPATLEPRAGNLQPFGITEAAFGQKIYGPLLETLEHAGSFTRTEPGTPAKQSERRYYVFAYDWRQDNVVSARALDAFIEQIRRDYARPNLKVDIVAHSMGGLLSRYYMRYGARDVLNGNDFPVTQAGARKVNKLILLGTPNLGSVGSLHSFLTGYRVVRTIPNEVLATMPSTYELLPHPLNDWIITAEGKPLDRDLFDTELWKRFQWSVFDPRIAARVQAEKGAAYLQTLQKYFAKRIERARRFVWSLTVPEPSTPVRLVVFGGDCELTPARVLVEEDGGDSMVRLYPDDIKHPVAGVDYGRLMLEPGDGRVTKPSLLARQSLDPTVPRHRYSFFPLAYSFFLCEGHDQLTGNINFQDNLLNVLLERSAPLRAGTAPPN